MLATTSIFAPVDLSGDPLLLVYEYLLSRAEAREMAPDETAPEEMDQSTGSDDRE